MLAKTLMAGRKVNTDGPVATCEVAEDAARRLGLPPAVRRGLSQVTAMWNGGGYPQVSGDDIAVGARITHVASTAVTFCLYAGADAAVAEVASRAGVDLDPELAAAFAKHAGSLLEGVDEIDAYQDVLDTEPVPPRLVTADQLESVALTFGSLVDLKSPRFHGHSAAVAALSGDAASLLGLDGDVATLRVAGHLHDLGRVAISSRIWDKAAAMTASEDDQARLHPYYSERIIARIPALGRVVPLVGQHHERCDGRGYPAGAAGSDLTMTSRVLASADSYRSLLEDRPGRPALSPAQAAVRLRQEARSGALDGDAVASVLAAAGHRQGARRPRPAGLTERQVEVLCLVASGMSNRDIARHLAISQRTAEHHVQDVYLRIGRSSRAGAALFAMEHGLMGKPG